MQKKLIFCYVWVLYYTKLSIVHIRYVLTKSHNKQHTVQDFLFFMEPRYSSKQTDEPLYMYHSCTHLLEPCEKKFTMNEVDDIIVIMATLNSNMDSLLLLDGSIITSIFSDKLNYLLFYHHYATLICSLLLTVV